jgi:hypothetical protein
MNPKTILAINKGVQVKKGVAALFFWVGYGDGWSGV